MRLADLLVHVGPPSAGGPRFRLLGIDDSVDVCDLCGKKDLKCTMVLQELDAEGNELGEVHYGRDCGARALGWGVSADRAEKLVRGEAKLSDDALYALWRPLAAASGGAQDVFEVELDGVPLLVRRFYGKSPPKGWNRTSKSGIVAWKLARVGSRSVAPQARAVSRHPTRDGKRSAPGRLAGGRRAFATPDVRRAQAAVREVLEGRGTPLGMGNFGAAYRAVVEGTPYVVKLGTRRTLHTRRSGELYPRRGEWSQGGRRIERVREELLHEVGVANELAARGHRVVPAAVYAEHKGKPALVREWGEIPANVTPQEYDDLARALFRIVEEGWHVNDDLLVARRADGSLFVADVGVWRRQARPQERGWNSAHAIAREDLASLLQRFSGEQPWAADPTVDRYQWGVPSIVELEYARGRLEEAKAQDRATGAKLWYKSTVERVGRMERARAWVGLGG